MVNADCRDRTTEFQNTIRTFQSRNVQKSPLDVDNKLNKHLQNRNQFMIIAKKIGKDLTNTCIKLEKLTTLAKKRSLFDDKTIEIQELSCMIKQNINSLNKEISELQHFVKLNQSQSGHNLQKHSNNVVITLQSKLAFMSKDFQQILELRTENLKQSSVRKEHFVKDNHTSALTLNTPKISGHLTKSILIDDQQSTNGETVINMDSIDKQQYQQRIHLMNEQDNYVIDRADAMQNIETTIIELGGIFQQLATMIKEQDELVQRIDDNVDSTEVNISAAHGELLKYFQSITSNRWLIIKIFFVLIIFFVVFVLLV